MTDYHVYGIGNALVDMEFEVGSEELAVLGVDKGLMTLIPQERHEELLGHLKDRECRRFSGGSAANTMIAVAQLGGQAFYSCKVADDDTGTFYMNDLAEAGVDSNLGADNREPGVTGKCIILITPDAERSMNTFLGATRELSPAELDEVAIRGSRWVYIEGYLVPEAHARQAAIRSRQVAREAGVKVSLTLSDVNMVRHFNDGLLEIADGGVDMLFSNEDEAMLATRSDTFDDCVVAMKSLAARFAITRGARGALLFDGDELIEIPARHVTAVDSTGAGDIYAGAFLHGLSHDMSFSRCGELAGEAATELVTRFGARLPAADLQAIGKRF